MSNHANEQLGKTLADVIESVVDDYMEDNYEIQKVVNLEVETQLTAMLDEQSNKLDEHDARFTVWTNEVTELRSEFDCLVRYHVELKEKYRAISDRLDLLTGQRPGLWQRACDCVRRTTRWM